MDGEPNADSIIVSIVVPLYNEESNLPELHRRLTAVLNNEGLAYEIIYIDDGGKDGTPRILRELAAADPRVRPIWLSRNFGHQAALTAGLDSARGRAVVVMDGDLQDPPELIPQLLQTWRSGAEVVYAVRRRRKESAWKRAAYSGFYRLWRRISELDVPLDSGDFGLMDRQVVYALRSMPEHARFVRGLRAYVGFRQVGLPYDRDSRNAGTSKYTFTKLLRLAIDGLISFSGRPLRLATYLGLTAAGIALLLTVWAIRDRFQTTPSAPPGWASLIVAVLFLGAVQLICLGILGEYLRLIFLECKQRPTYIRRDRPPEMFDSIDEKA